MQERKFYKVYFHELHRNICVYDLPLLAKGWVEDFK